MNLIKTYIISFFFLLSFSGFAQKSADSLKQLNVVEVESSRSSSFSTGNKTQQLDSTLLAYYSANTVADLLTNQSQVFIKSYGPGSLATTSIRGGGAAHTAVLWNGFNIQSPTLGILDLSLVPVNFLNEVNLQYGASSALWGSGAVGGVIHLNNTPRFNKGINISAGVVVGSFSDNQQQMNLELSKKRFITSFKFFNHTAKNDFTYTNTSKYDHPQQKQNNAELKQYGLMQENYFQINKHQKINTRFWYQWKNANIPPPITQIKSDANQKDECIRVTSEWQRTSEKLMLFARIAHFNEMLLYSNPSSKINSKIVSKTTIIEAESRWKVSKLSLLNIGLNNTYTEAISKNYNEIPSQNRMAIFGSYKIQTLKNNFNTVLNFRQEFLKGKAIPFTASLGIEGAFLKWFQIKANISKHYRIPTFDDLYYTGQGGLGNRDLKPESGWAQEISLLHNYKIKKVVFELGATVFNRTIDNWIIWLPSLNDYWQPNNIMKVWSRGAEYQLKLNYEIRQLKFQLNGMWNYTVSTNEKAKMDNDASVGKQLIYTPMYMGNASFTISYKGFSIMYNQKYVGYTYTSSDSKKYLNPYLLANINASQLIIIHQLKVYVFASVNNIFNQKYQVMQNRAMPLRYYQIGLQININKPNNNK